MTDPLAPLMAEAASCRAAGDAAGAIRLYRRAALAAPRRLWPRHALLETLLATLLDPGAFAEAEALAGEVLAIDPDDLPALLARATLCRRTGRPAAALPWIERALAAHPAAPWPRLALAETRLEAGQPREAEAAFAAVLTTTPDQYQAMVGLGLARAAGGHHAAAAEALAAAVRAYPDRAWPRLALAESLLALDRPAAAEAECRAVLAAEPAQLQALVHAASCRRRQGDPEAAVALLGQAMAAHPAEPWPHLAAAETLLPLGRPAAAEAALRHGLAARPGDAGLLHALSGLLELQGRIGEAREAAAAAVAAAPGVVAHHVALSRCHALAGDQAAAVEALAPVAASPEAALWRAELEGRAGLWAAAAARLAAARAAHPAHPGLASRAARAALRAGASPPLVPPPGAPPAERARFLVLQGEAAGFDLPAARAAYRAAASLDPGNPEAAEGEARIALLMLDEAATRAALATAIRLRAAERAAQGLVARPSQTHVGQLLDEFTCDAACLAALREAAALPAATRAPRLRQIAAAWPGLTAPAILLLIALREAGGFRPAPHRAGPRRPAALPRMVAQYWEAPDLPPDLAALSASWHAPSWRHARLDRPNAVAFLARHTPPPVREAFHRAASPAQRADLLRLAWLFVEGGLWADIDDRCLAGPATLLGGAGLFLWQESHGALGNNLIAAPPGHPLIGRALEIACRAVLSGDADMIWLATGPGALTRAFAQWLPPAPAEWPEALAGLALPDAHQLAAQVAVQCPAAYKLRGPGLPAAAGLSRKPAPA